MENPKTSWHKRRELIVPILVGVIFAILPVVVPMNWFWMLICWLMFSICIIWLILILFSKTIRYIILTGTIILLFFGGFYRVHDQWIKDYSAHRPHISIAAIGFPNILLSPGIISIMWEIKNDGQVPAYISEANMTLWFETIDARLPNTPQYVPTLHLLRGIIIVPGNPFNATFKSTRSLSSAEVDAIIHGKSTVYVFGYVKYHDDKDRLWSKGFIARYRPDNDPRFGMFEAADEDHKSYSYDK